jgi:hypothetical protein
LYRQARHGALLGNQFRHQWIVVHDQNGRVWFVDHVHFERPRISIPDRSYLFVPEPASPFDATSPRSRPVHIEILQMD